MNGMDGLRKWGRGMAGLLVVIVGAAYGQSASPSPLPPPLPVAPAGPPAPVAMPADVRGVLTMLQNRKDTLKDFTANISKTEVDRTGDSTTKTGTLAVINDPKAGLIFSADFTKMKVGGRTRDYHLQYIFDGHTSLIKDFGNDAKQFVRQEVVAPGAPAGSATSLDGPMPLPIGLDPDDVVRNFDVTMQPSADPNQAVLSLVPREKGKDFTSLEVTVDKSKQIPVKLVEVPPGAAAGGLEKTIIELTGAGINSGKAKMLSVAVPASEGWTERKQ